MIGAATQLLAAAAPASAHAIVQSTEPQIDQVVPASPDRVLMRFNEPVEVSFGGIRVFDSNGERVDEGETDHVEGEADEIEVGLEGELPDGTYTVAWRIVSIDGHPISEAFVFHVGAPGDHPQGIASRVLNSNDSSGVIGALFGAVRLINFAALLALGGAIVFAFTVWIPSIAMSGSAMQAEFTSRFRSIVIIALGTLVATTLVGFLLQGASAGDLSLLQAASPDVLARVMQTRYGVVGLIKLGLLVAAAAFWKLGLKPMLHASNRQSVGAAGLGRVSTTTAAVGLLIVGSLVATPGLAGHPGSTSPVALNVSADVLHMVAVAAWIGGLFTLIWAGLRSANDVGERDRARALAPVIGRFSKLATVAVGVVVITGAYRSWVEVGALRGFTNATYGWVLLVKIAVFMPLLALGAINNRWTTPRIASAAREEGDRAVGALRTLRRLVAGEVAVATVMLALTALLVNLPPARVAAGVVGPFVTDVQAGEFDLSIVVDPNEVGENLVHLTATTSAGAPARVRAMTVLFRMPSQEIGPIEAQGRRLALGHYVVQGHQLSVPGKWQLEIVVQTGIFDEERTTVSLTVNN